MSHPKLVIGSRNSVMAQIMANSVRDQLVARCADVDVEVKFFSSQGDRFQGDLSKIGGKGAFVKDLEEFLLMGAIDCAVHSLKDVPGDQEPHPDLTLSCFLEREDPRDVLIMRDGVSAPEAGRGEGLTLATSSPRRQAFLRHLYPNARIISLRGNVDTRLKKLHAGEFDGMVLAKSGLERMALEHHISKVFEPEEMLPAVGQGIMCVQTRTADAEKCVFLDAIASAEATAAVLAERTMLRRLRGHCHAAIAGYCTTDSATGERWLRGWVSDLAGCEAVFAEARQLVTDDPSTLGLQVADALIGRGAERLIGGELCRAAG